MDLRRARTTDQCGFTLVELLAVMAILGILAGLSITAMRSAGQGSAIEGSERITRAAIARGRALARERAAPTEVWFQPGEASEIWVAALEDAGTWTFEGDFGQRALAGNNVFSTLQGARLVEDGSLLGGVDLTRGSVVTDQIPAFDPTRGFRFEADLKPENADASGEVASYGDVWSLGLDSGGRLSATLSVQDEGKAISLATGPNAVPAGRYSRIGLEVDGLTAKLRVRGVVLAEAPLKPVEPIAEGAQARPPEESGPQLRRLASPITPPKLIFGAKGLAARLDEVSYRTVEEGERARLPGGIEFDLSAPLFVRFGPEGRLDPRFHEGSVSVTLIADGERRELVIDPAGVLR